MSKDVVKFEEVQGATIDGLPVATPISPLEAPQIQYVQAFPLSPADIQNPAYRQNSPVRAVTASPVSPILDKAGFSEPSAPHISLMNLDSPKPISPFNGFIEPSAPPSPLDLYSPVSAQLNKNVEIPQAIGPISPIYMNNLPKILSPLQYTTALSDPSIYVQNAAAAEPAVNAMPISPLKNLSFSAPQMSSPLRVVSPLGVPSSGIAAMPIQKLEAISREDKIRASDALNTINNGMALNEVQAIPQFANLYARIDIDDAVRLEASNPGSYIPLGIRKLIWWDEEGSPRALGENEVIAPLQDPNDQSREDYKALYKAIESLEMKKSEHLIKLGQNQASAYSIRRLFKRRPSEADIYANAASLAMDDISLQLQEGFNKSVRVKKIFTDSFGNQDDISDEEREKIARGVSAMGAYTIGWELTKGRDNVANQQAKTPGGQNTETLEAQLRKENARARMHGKADLKLATQFFKETTLLPVDFVKNVFELLNEGNPNNQKWLDNVLKVIEQFSKLLKMPFESVEKMLDEQINNFIDAHVPAGQRASIKAEIKEKMEVAKPTKVYDYSAASAKVRDESKKSVDFLHGNYRNTNISISYDGGVIPT